MGQGQGQRQVRTLTRPKEPGPPKEQGEKNGVLLSASDKDGRARITCN